MNSSSDEYKNKISQNDVGAVPNGMLIASFIVAFPTLTKQFFITWFIVALSDVLLKPIPPFIFSSQHAILLLDNLIKVLSLPLKSIQKWMKL